MVSAETTPDQYDQIGPWVSTDTSSEAEPAAQRRRYVATGFAEPIYVSPVRPLLDLARLWVARINTPEGTSEELFARYAFTGDFFSHSAMDESVLGADWASFWWPAGQQLLVTEGELLDWEAAIEPPPAARSGSIRVSLEFGGRSEPLPEDNPWAE